VEPRRTVGIEKLFGRHSHGNGWAHWRHSVDCSWGYGGKSRRKGFWRRARRFHRPPRAAPPLKPAVQTGRLHTVAISVSQHAGQVAGFPSIAAAEPAGAIGGHSSAGGVRRGVGSGIHAAIVANDFHGRDRQAAS